MTELTPGNIIKFAQEAAILKHHVAELEKLLDSCEEKKLKPHPKEIAEVYNKILKDSRELFALDTAFVDAISHLKEAKIFPEGHLPDQWTEIRKLLPQLKILKGTVDAFFEWLELLKEKKDT